MCSNCSIRSKRRLTSIGAVSWMSQTQITWHAPVLAYFWPVLCWRRASHHPHNWRSPLCIGGVSVGGCEHGKGILHDTSIRACLRRNVCGAMMYRNHWILDVIMYRNHWILEAVICDPGHSSFDSPRTRSLQDGDFSK